MANEKITIDVTANTTQAQNKLKSFSEQLERIGGKLTQAGGILTAAFTAPIVGAFAAAISQSKELQAALLPIQQAFQGVAVQFGQALIPIVRELTPALIGIAQSLSEIVKWFTELDPTMQKVVLGFAALLAAVGPVLVIVGQLFQFAAAVTSIASAIPGLSAAMVSFGATASAALTPLLPLLVAIAGLMALINSEFGKSGIQAGKQLLTMGVAGGVALFGGADAGKKAFYDTGNAIGAFNQPVPAGRSGGQTVIYNNYGIDANNPHVKQAMQPYINGQLRDNRQR